MLIQALYRPGALLPKYQVLFLVGYGQDRHEHERRAVYDYEADKFGDRYLCVNLDTFTFSKETPGMVHDIETVTGCPIGIYFRKNDLADPEEVAEAIKKARKLAQAKTEEKEAAGRRKERLSAIGKKWFEDHAPADTKAVIIAELMQDDSDSQTDYFGGHTVRTVVLSFSKHKRDLFPEMRKAAATSTIPGIRELATAPENYEHREKYSMGAGYYIGHARYSGWRISKRGLQYSPECLYLAKGEEISATLPDDTGAELEPTVILRDLEEAAG